MIDYVIFAPILNMCITWSANTSMSNANKRKRIIRFFHLSLLSLFPFTLSFSFAVFPATKPRLRLFRPSPRYAVHEGNINNIGRTIE